MVNTAVIHMIVVVLGLHVGHDLDVCVVCCCVFFFKAEDGIRVLVRSRGLGDVYKRQTRRFFPNGRLSKKKWKDALTEITAEFQQFASTYRCLLYTSDAADERSSVDLGGRRIIKKTKRYDDPGGRAVRQKSGI